jgi:oligosaccharide repeat unit polymerase
VIAQATLLILTFGFFRLVGADSIVLRGWCAAWALSTLFSIPLEWRSWFDLSPASAYLFIVTVLMGLGGAVAQSARPPEAAHNYSASARSRLPGPGTSTHIGLIVLCTALGVLSVGMLLDDLGYSYRIFLSLEELVEAAAAASLARYSDDFDPAPLTRFVSSFLFIGAFLSGWYSRRATGPHVRWLTLAAFLPASAWTVVLTTKANVLLWLVFYFAASWSFGQVAVSGGDRGRWAIFRRSVLVASVFVVLIAGLFLVQVSRYGGDIAAVSDDAVSALAVSAVGHVFAFREWFEASSSPWPLTWGSKSFSGAFDVLGIARREMGIYGAENIVVGESFTNVYSAVRNLIDDFGTVVTCCLFAVVGFVGTWAQHGARTSSAHGALLSIVLSWVLWSPITSLFNYNSIIFSGLALFAISLLGRNEESQ